MLRVVLDHVALTSALLNPHGHAARVLDRARQGLVRLLATKGMLETEARLLRRPLLSNRLDMTAAELDDFLADMVVLFCLVPEMDTPAMARSPEAALLWCAQQGRADALVVSSPLPEGSKMPEETQVIRVDQLVELVDHGS